VLNGKMHNYAEWDGTWAADKHSAFLLHRTHQMLACCALKATSFFKRVQAALQKHNLLWLTRTSPRTTPHPLLLPPCTGDDDADCVPLHKYEWCQVISPF
jgi:hypothetical protein